MRYIAGTENVTANLLSRIQSFYSSNHLDYDKLSDDQQVDVELQSLVRSGTHKLKLSKFTLPSSQKEIYCDIWTGRLRPFVTKPFRQVLIEQIHNLAHPSRRTTAKLMTDRFVWPGIRSDTTSFVKNCLRCQRAKVDKHTTAPLVPYLPLSRRFEHINIDIVGPLPICTGQRYCLTIVDRFTRWHEAIPMPDMTAESVANALIDGWFSRYGIPATISSDRGSQFESTIFNELLKIVGCNHFKTTSYHPQSNGIIGRWQRTLKAAILCHTPEKWPESFRSTWSSNGA